MFQEITRNEYERSIDYLRGIRDRTFQIARISGIMFAIFATVTIFIQPRGGEIHAVPKITFIAGFAILTVFGIELPVFFAYVSRKLPEVLLVNALRLARDGVIKDDYLYELMIHCTHENRETVRIFDWWLRRVMVPGMLVGISAVLVAVVWLCRL